MIDTDVCHRRRWKSLPFNTRSALEQNHFGPSVLSVKTPDFGIGQVRWGKGGQLGTDTPTYGNIQNVCRNSAVDGYFCYDEMFMWAGELIDTTPVVIDVLRDRFPILLIDEAQDNSKEQSAILSRIFIEGDNAVIRQRFGDANQAIFDFQGAKEAATDKFPDVSKMELPNSHRFSQTIADIADPLGLEPYGLQGLGPKKSLASGSQAGQHTIFLFDENSAAKVLDAYGELLLETFSDLELREEWFTATAVGQIHRPPDEDNDHKFPHHIGHYWPDYAPELAKHAPTPLTFMQYVFAGQCKSEFQHETHAMVEKIAEGFLRLSDFTAGEKSLARPKHSHRHILQLLETSPDIRVQYQNLIVQFTVRRETPTTETWEGHWRGIARSIAEAIAGSPLSAEADGFLMWNDTPVTPTTSTDANRSRNNIFRYRKNGREVSIQAGSIHSVKGQTHTATLVLETFWNDHNLELILPWFTQKKYGWKKADGVRQEARLKLHYVAMTRPTHLLCLAMKQSVLNAEHMGVIRTLGWRLLQVKPDGSTVLLEPA
ncbi:MAG: UvrD-helicase domain-containing protein [Sulfuricella sp.]